MTKQQFIKRRAEFEQRDRRFNTIYMIVFFALLLANIPLSSCISDSYSSLYIAIFLALLFGNAAIMFWRDMGQAKRAGLVCGSCKGGLLGIQGHLAIATGTCGHCGQQAFDA